MNKLLELMFDALFLLTFFVFAYFILVAFW